MSWMSASNIIKKKLENEMDKRLKVWDSNSHLRNQKPPLIIFPKKLDGSIQWVET